VSVINTGAIYHTRAANKTALEGIRILNKPIAGGVMETDNQGSASEIEQRRILANRRRLDLLEKIWNVVSSRKQVHPMIAGITGMVQQALNASASSLLLLDGGNEEMVFMFAEGPVANRLKRLRIDTSTGVVGWVARNGKPVIVNDVRKDRRFDMTVDKMTNFVTRSIICAPLVVRGKVIGVIEVLNKINGSGFYAQDLRILVEVANTMALAIDNIKLNESLLYSYKSTASALVSLADSKELSGGGHSKRVANFALMGAAELGFNEGEKSALEYAAILHDIGKLRIPDRILNKQEALTPEEWETVRKHPITGYNLLKDIPFLKEASKLILCHHERWDGKGYPRGLKGEDIPLGARLLGVVDAFDHMTTKHAYRDARDNKFAFTELRRCAGSQFCPTATKAFCSGFIKSHLSGKL
jgi:putative nucleotidyltransferase with HDIG domain